MAQISPQRDSFLFTVRLWAEDVSQAQPEWRGQLCLVSSGEIRYFRDWQAMVALLRSLLPDTDSQAHREEEK